MKNFIKCELCLAMAEHKLLNLDLCTYHFVILANDNQIITVVEKA